VKIQKGNMIVDWSKATAGRGTGGGSCGRTKEWLGERQRREVGKGACTFRSKYANGGGGAHTDREEEERELTPRFDNERFEWGVVPSGGRAFKRGGEREGSSTRDEAASGEKGGEVRPPRGRDWRGRPEKRRKGGGRRIV